MTDGSHKFSIGDTVLVVQLRRRGTIAEGPNQRGELLVSFGALSAWIDPKKLAPSVAEAEPKKKAKDVVRRSAKQAAAREEHRILRIDLHGMTREEALRLLEETLDRALRGEGACLEVIHGLGKGTLRDAVNGYLRKSKVVKEYRPDTKNPGVTWVYL